MRSLARRVILIHPFGGVDFHFVPGPYQATLTKQYLPKGNDLCSGSLGRLPVMARRHLAV